MAVSVAAGASRTRLDVRAVVEALERGGVRYVFTGSVAAAAWGVELEEPPGDFDLAPDLAPENLERLASLLEEAGARPVHRPDWKRGLSLEEIARWSPRPATPEQLDHQMTTPWGLLDVVPKISGEHTTLERRAVKTTAWGIEVRVAHPADLLATLRADREEKHVRRRPGLDAARLRAEAGDLPTALERQSAVKG